MGIFTTKKPSMARRALEAGNIFLMLFGAVGMVGVIGASTMTVMKCPVRTMSIVKKRTIAENNMIASGRLAVVQAAAQTNNDCDGDGTIEPVDWTSSSGLTGGGDIPVTIGAAQQDPWGRNFGYCIWNHGDNIDATGGAPGCSSNYLNGDGSSTTGGYLLAIVSAGPDGTFQTECKDDPDYVDKPSGSDDLYLGYTYAEAEITAGAGLWNLNSSDSDIAEIEKDISVTNAAGQLAFGIAQVNDGGADRPAVRADYISALSNTAVDLLSPVTSDSNITTTGDVSATDLIATRDTSVGRNLNVTNNIRLTTGNMQVGTGNGLNIREIGGGSSEPIRVGGIHVGGAYAGSVPVDGEIVTSGLTDVDIKPGGTTALTLDATTQNGTFGNELTVGSDLNLTNGRIVTTSGGIALVTPSNHAAHIWTDGIHIGGNYTATPSTGEITTTDTTNIVLKPGGTTALTLDAATQNANFAGNVGIGQDPAAGVELDVLGDIEYTGTLNGVSDRRLKKNIKPLSDMGSALDLISQVDTYSFQMIDDKDNRTQFGVIAQELEEIFPDLVNTAPDEMKKKSVNYVGLIAPVIEAVKEIKALLNLTIDRIGKLFDKVTKLEQENKALQAEVDNLKSQNQDIIKRLESLEANDNAIEESNKVSSVSK